MFYSLTLCFIGFLGFQMVSAQNAPELEERALCERYPQLRICALRYDLDQAIQEMSYLVRVSEQQPSHLVVSHPELITGKDKRKSAFVRFGKRSVQEDSSTERQEPVEVVINSRPTRKSSFVRFG